jgi:ATP-binding cassette subfamily F protein uup
MLVTHDRFLLESRRHRDPCLDGAGGAEWFADTAQWEAARREAARPGARGASPARAAAPRRGRGSSA